MPTPVQRASSIFDALVNQATPAATKVAGGRAAAFAYGRLAEYDAATNAEKSAIFLESVRRWLMDHDKQLRGADGRVEMQAAKDAAVVTDWTQAG